jgi:hypothetical protein
LYFSRRTGLSNVSHHFGTHTHTRTLHMYTHTHLSSLAHHTCEHLFLPLRHHFALFPVYTNAFRVNEQVHHGLGVYVCVQRLMDGRVIYIYVHMHYIEC